MSDELASWRKVEDLPSLEELNRALARCSEINRQLLMATANDLDEEYCHPSHFRHGLQMMDGFRFCPKSGSVLMVFPNPWPASPAHRCASLYLMGETTAVDYSDIVGRFHDALDKRTKPPHSG